MKQTKLSHQQGTQEQKKQPLLDRAMQALSLHHHAATATWSGWYGPWPPCSQICEAWVGQCFESRDEAQAPQTLSPAPWQLVVSLLVSG